MSKGQKEAVVDQIMSILPNFSKFKDNAILLISNDQLEIVKENIFQGIINGDIEYGKDRSNRAEVRTYARSMVMNHLKKAKELNGGQVNNNNASSVSATNTSTSNRAPSKMRSKLKKVPKGVNPNILSDELKEYAEYLVP